MNGDIRDQLAKGYEAIENAKACFDKAKEMLEAKESAPPRNWPKRIEAGMVFRVNGESMMVPNGKPVSYVIALTGEKVGMSHYGWESAPGIEYLGHARDILTIRTDAHEPTGAELVECLKSIRDVSTNPGRTLTVLGLTECLESAHRIAVDAIRKLTK